MFRVFVVAPWMIIVAAVIHGFILLDYIWAPYSAAFKLKQEGKDILSTPRRYSFYRAFTLVFGIIYLDSGIKLLLGALGFENMPFIMPAAILFVIVGIEYSIRFVFAAPNHYDFKVGIGISVMTLFFLWVYLPLSKNLMISISSLLFTILLGWFLLGPIFRLRLRNFKTKDALAAFYQPRYNKQAEIEKYFNPVVDIILWLLIIIEVLLKFEGYSLITILF